MATPIDLLDPPTVMSYGGLVDASTAVGQADEAADWTGAVEAMLVVHAGDAAATSGRGDQNPPARLAHITQRRGAFSPAR